MIASDKSLALIRGNNKQAFGDGTFRYAPKGYYQMYTFHIHESNTYVQVAYFLLLKKTLKTYVTMFEMLKERCGTVDIFQLDFEVGVHTAVARVFPEAGEGLSRSLKMRCSPPHQEVMPYISSLNIVKLTMPHQARHSHLPCGLVYLIKQ